METISPPKQVKARKQHVCNFCGKKIKLGEEYISSTHKSEGDVYNWKSHKHCAAIAERMKMYDEAEDGVTMEIFTETISEKHHQLLTEQLPADIPKTVFSEISSQLSHVEFNHKLWYVIRFYNKLDRMQYVGKQFSGKEIYKQNNDWFYLKGGSFIKYEVDLDLRAEETFNKLDSPDAIFRVCS